MNKPVIYPSVFTDEGDSNVDMSLIEGMRFSESIEGLAMMADGLSLRIYTDFRDNSHTLEKKKMNSIKIFKITNHAVIGFVGGGVGIADEEFKGFADDINNRLRGRDTLTHDEIAREAVTYLESRSDKLTDSVGLSGLIAAYDYRLGKPENPRLITMQRKDGSFGYHIERDKYSAIDEKSKGFIVNRSQFYFESVYTIRSLTYNQAKNAMLELMKFVRENAQYGYFIGGEVNVWRITEEGIYMEPNIFKFVDSEKLKEGTQIKVPSP